MEVWHWAILLTILAATGAVFLFLFRNRRRLKHTEWMVADLHKSAGGIPVGDAQEILREIRANRTNMVTNHDELDGELKPLREDVHWLKRTFGRYLTFLQNEQDPPTDPANRRKKFLE